MLASFGWGFLAASSLIMGGALALWYRVGERTLGIVMAFGSGVLISAVAFEPVEEAFAKAGGKGGVASGLFAGSVSLFRSDAFIHRSGRPSPKNARGLAVDGSAPA